MTNRRDFLKTGGVAVGAIAAEAAMRKANSMPYAIEAPAPATPVMDAATRELMMEALNASKMAGADYADVRIGRYRANFVQTREQQIVNVADTDSMGCGVRALVDGTWGFGATRTLTKDGVASAAKKAVAVAKATRLGRDKAVELAPAPSNKDVAWQNAFTIDPWTVPIEQKADLLLKANAAAMKAQNVRFVFSAMFFRKDERNYANTDGSVVTQTIIHSWVPMQITAVAPDPVGFPEPRQRQPSDGPRLRVCAGPGYRRERSEMGRGGIAEVEGEGRRRRPLRSRAAPESPVAHDPRVNRPSNRARPGERLRGKPRRHQLHRAARQNARQAQVRPGVHECSGRQVTGWRTVDRWVRRRRREARRLPVGEERNLQRLSDDTRTGQLAQVVVRFAGTSDAIARLLVWRLMVERAIPADA
jgi:hypothetical protein